MNRLISLLFLLSILHACNNPPGKKTANPGIKEASMDMTTAYEDEAGQVQRGYKILENLAVLIRDEISDIQNMDFLRWAIVTDSDISISGNSAVFTKEGKAFYLNIIEPQDAG